jgi:hypothetical protein
MDRKHEQRDPLDPWGARRKAIREAEEAERRQRVRDRWLLLWVCALAILFAVLIALFGR